MRWDTWFRKLALNFAFAAAVALMPALQGLSTGQPIDWHATWLMALGAGAVAVLTLVVNLLKHLGDETDATNLGLKPGTPVPK
jgi:hypothetical protein